MFRNRETIKSILALVTYIVYLIALFIFHSYGNGTAANTFLPVLNVCGVVSAALLSLRAVKTISMIAER